MGVIAGGGGGVETDKLVTKDSETNLWTLSSNREEVEVQDTN